jgi:hypothetical protein
MLGERLEAEKCGQKYVFQRFFCPHLSASLAFFFEQSQVRSPFGSPPGTPRAYQVFFGSAVTTGNDLVVSRAGKKQNQNGSVSETKQPASVH